ncbi:DUF317 domain-containing protein [Yinghuangia sp. ASG 101]|uniref:DUF317 domain-containing protein n=1 Tax=Yinghuangia sp. ASG 101 TaxID=2896848 RepID=UPI001E379327|nr:DUF317 domain-containing protein [Yinghuangia sp. ASG 101]UGQ13594.1 DUF317 domain-containing protein [Yinghuangia sp. ASG 101]
MTDNTEMCAVPVRFADGSIPGEALAVIHAADWPMVKDRLANVHARRPDGALYVGWLPEDGGPWLWEVERTRETGGIVWTASFSSGVPATAVAAFLRALTAPAGADGAACADVAAADATLRGAGWQVHDAGTPPWDGYDEGTTPWQVLARHGEGDLKLAFLDVRSNDAIGDIGPDDAPLPRAWPAWALACAAGPAGPVEWWAELGRETPADAVAAFLAAVTAADLVNRPIDELSAPVRRRFA